MAIGKYIEVAMLGSSVSRGGGVKNIANIFGFYRVIETNPLVKADINAAFQAAIGDVILAALSIDYVQNANTIRWKDDATDAPTSFTQAGVGGIAGERGPDFMAVKIGMKSATRGRHAQGRKHFGPIAEVDTLGDVLSAAAGAVTRFNAVAAAMLAGFTDAGGSIWKPVVYSSAWWLGPNYTTNPTIVFAYPIISCTLNKSMGTMARRKVRTVV